MALNAAPASAQCTTAASAVTCIGTIVTSDINTAIFAAPAPSLTLRILAGAVVTQDQFYIQPNSASIGTIDIGNAGMMGTAAATVGFSYVGSAATAANLLTFNNSGTVTGAVFANDVGGKIALTNTGTLEGGVSLLGAGDIALTSSGPIYVASGGASALAVRLESYASTTTSTGTAGVDGVTTSIAKGGAVSGDITGPVAIPAAGVVASVPQGIDLNGLGGARLNLNAAAGNVVLNSSNSNSSSTTGGSNVSTVAGLTTVTGANSTTAAGGTVSATLGSDSSVTALSLTAGPGTATASVAGKVGSATANGGVNVFIGASNTATASKSTSNATMSTSDSSTVTTRIGGAASIDLASTGTVFGSLNATSNAGAARIAIAGTVGAGAGTAVTTNGNAAATSIGTSISFVSSSTNTFATGDFTSSNGTTRSAAGGAAAVSVAATGSVFGSINASGDGSASVDNAGRIRDGVTLASGRFLSVSSSTTSSQVTTPGAAGASTVVSLNSNASVNTTVGGTTSLFNRAGAVIEDNVSIAGVGAATIDNAGAIFGNVSTSSTGNTSTNGGSNTFSSSNPATPGAGVAQTVQVSSSSSSSTAIGGTVTGNYSGSIGAIAGSGLPLAISVSQNGQAGSSATIGGVLLANFNASAGASSNTGSNSSTNTTTTQPFTGPATAAVEALAVSTQRNATTIQAGNNTVTVTGALRSNGNSAGNLTASTQSGTTNVTVTGGIVQGSINLDAGIGTNTTSGTDNASRSTVAATTAGPAATAIAQSSSSIGFSEFRGAAGTSNLVLTGATVGGGVGVNGRGSGVGTNGASVSISADSSVTGFLNVSTYSATDQRNDNSTVNSRTGAATVTQTNHSTSVSTAPGSAGNSTATIAGRVAGANISSAFGNAAATLTGQITGGNSINLSTGTTLSSTQTDTSFAGTSATALSFPTQTGSLSATSATYQGGTAVLAINSSAVLQTAGTSAVNGSITVSGVAGSTLSIGAGTRVLANNGSSIFTGFTLANSTNRTTNTFSKTGVQTGGTIVSTSTLVGGAAAFSNAGIVGASTGFFGAPDSVSVQSIGGASAVNTGTIFGAVSAQAIGVNTATTTVTTDINDVVLTRGVATTISTGVGGVASVTNSGVISGNVFLSGATGTATNTGVLRNGVSLGQSLVLGTNVVTTTPTSSVRVMTAPATRFAQTYVVNQSGLLIGGINVNGATVADNSTGAATTAVLRTSDITATINLNAGSVTTGNILAQVVSVTDNTRLTNTTLRLNDAGFLGVGTSDLPSGVLGTGATALHFVNTPNYAGFAAIDPALGSSASGVFVAATSIGSGSQISGVTLVDKTGAGSFTILGSTYRAPSTANVLPFYTMDVGTFRVSAGEVQLGSTGTDPATGASIFGIRGNVENIGGTLLLGRRVTDGTTTVVQGTNVRIDGNLTQAAAGTLSIVATPALLRNAGTPVRPLVADGILGYGGYGIELTPFVAYDATKPTILRSTPSTLTVNGNVTLAGTVAVAATQGTIYTAGRNYDLLTVSGTYNGTGLSLAPSFASPFVRFAMTPRTVGTSTVVSVDVVRTSYASVTHTANAAAAAVALEGAIPSIVSRITAIPNPNAVVDVQAYGRLQDLATVIAGIDTQLSSAEAAAAFVQLGSASVYGSLAAIQTTSVFGEAADSVISEKAGVGIWFRPTSTFSKFDGSTTSGASSLKADDYGGSLGASISTGNGGEFGIGGGYGRIDANDRELPSRASARTYLVGIYGHQKVAAFDLSAQAVFGWSNWDTERQLPLFSRTAAASFDSKEFRINARLSYDFALGALQATPFAKLEARNYRFGAFEEQGVGGIGLAVAAHKKTVFSPELGVRFGNKIGIVTPFVEGSYILQGKVDAIRTASYLGDRSTSFKVQGVNPKGYAKLGAGVATDFYGVGFSLRGNYQTGSGNDATQVMGGINVRF
ncbi:hypothetical protein [Glacieibacterium sp.]|uniref:hypothetical protein n=1 Tax=Glacieibacterium sp. TaxID=2860237 RepID=UPI003B0064B7